MAWTKEQRSEYMKEYRKSKNGVNSKKRSREKYRSSEKYKENLKNLPPRTIDLEKSKEYSRRYRDSERGKEIRKRYASSLKGKYISYSNGAKQRGYDFSLTSEEFEVFWQKPCYYCGEDIETIGLDRIYSNS